MALHGYPRPQDGLASHICHENDDEDCAAGTGIGERGVPRTGTVPDRVHFCSGGTGGSVDGPSSGTLGRRADTRHIRHTGCLLGLGDRGLSGAFCDS
jgi:hypothetical protein